MADRFTTTHGPEIVNGKWTPWGQFAQQRRDAKGRRIPFLLNFEQWLQIWEQSGVFSKRGSKKGQYVMARYGDSGPYSITNVKIILCEENHCEANLGKPSYVRTPAIRAKLSRSHTGKKLSLEHRQAISKGCKGNGLGIPKSEEHKRKLSIAKKQWYKQHPVKKKTCQIPNCIKVCYAKGLCLKHYNKRRNEMRHSK